MQLKRLVFLLFGICAAPVLLAQQTTVTLPLTDMSAFRPQAGNWRIVGSVSIDPDRDIHEAHTAPAPVTGKKKSKAPEPAPLPFPVTSQTGTGILLNMNDEKTRDQLLTVFEHGDIDLELEVMMPKGSNSGVYLQGRYEVQLLDSWGVKDPKYSDIGGIYRNWESEKGKIYMGKAPLTNPAKAPGLWQKFHIVFKAPRFDASGKKISNAMFLSVELNGVKIHDHVEVPLPTGGPIQNNEVALGPLMIQGDHGPVAFRNIRYRLLKDVTVSVSNLSYATYYGSFKTFSDFTSLKPNATGAIDELTCEVLENENDYGLVYRGNLTVAEDDTYNFVLAYNGGGRLVVNGTQLTNFQGFDGWFRHDAGSIALKAGTYPFEIYNFKGAAWLPPRLGLYVVNGLAPVVLHAYNSFPPDDQPVSPILIEPGSAPRLLRAFLDFKGDRSQRLTHTIGVGDPGGVHYVYDMKAGNLACVWRGPFVDATPMWHDRGDGSFRPMGAVQYIHRSMPLYFLDQPDTPFPELQAATQLSETRYRGKGYRLEEGSGMPVFIYSYSGVDVEDKVYPASDRNSVTHELIVKNRGTRPGLFYKLAEGKDILAAPNGAWLIDESFYIKVASGSAVVRTVDGKKELILPVDGNIQYTIVW
ncbi:MAG: family 16 glycoside hydrolase [Cyclobacteriaceae bacterium]